MNKYKYLEFLPNVTSFNLYYRAVYQFNEPCAHVLVFARERMLWRSYGICTLQCLSDEIKTKHDGVHCLDVLVGPSGAGKSTWCELNAKPHDVLSTDKLREQYGWGHTPEDLAKTWNYAHSLLKARLENQIYTVFDATNIKRKDRLKLLSNVPKGQYVRYIVIDRPFNIKIRDRGWRSEELVLKHDRTFNAQIKDILNGDNLPNVVVIDKRNMNYE